MNPDRDFSPKPAKMAETRIHKACAPARPIEQKARQFRLAELRKQEDQLVSGKPSAESLMNLADEYHALGLTKESDRLHRMAEMVENGDQPHDGQPAQGLLSGTASPMMIAEMVQILSRTMRTGELVIDGRAETYHIFFDRGQIINASSQMHPEGLRSFSLSLRVTYGTYWFCEIPVKNIKHIIQGNTDMLLLNAMHEADVEKSCNQSL